ncbi:MAG: S9 family peptidase [Saprospiraceae bacterium]
MNKIFALTIFAFLLTTPFTQAQEAVSDQITLEDIWRNYKFYAQSVPGFNFQNDGKHYTRLEENAIVQYDLTSGKQTKVLFAADQAEDNADFSGKISGYTFSDDESKIMIKSESESIYRRSSKANFYLWDGKKLTTIFSEGKTMYTTINSLMNKAAFVYENNLYVKDLNGGTVTQITKDGKQNEIINGSADWVYEEEFSFAKAFHWSPDGKKIAFYRFDESGVKEFTMTNYTGGLYPEYETFKYPKVGEDNALVTIHIYDTETGKITKADTGTETDQYIPRITWTPDNELVVFRMNRHQNHLELLLADTKTGVTQTLLEEKNKYYIDIHDNLTFLENGKQFVWTSEKDGYNHIYLYDKKGKQLRQLTKGDWEVTNFYGVDEKNGLIYFQAAQKSPMDREIYSVSLKGKGMKTIAGTVGYNSAQFSSTFDYYVNNYSNINTAPTYTVYNRAGKVIRVIEDNQRIAQLQKGYDVENVEFFDFKTSEDVQLNGYMIKPANFDSRKKYPVFMYQYSGPGSQQVTNSWKGQNYWWFQSLADQGYIIACVDGRGTGARGEEFKKQTYLNLGDLETKDQIEAGKYLGSLPYADVDRIGIFGWSYGGYMSSLAILKGNDVFKAAIAVAPVTSWKWYDTIYTERYMRTLKENEAGYEDNSPINFADRLKGNYLLVHGNSDDNVHFQQTAEMANALIKADKQFETYFYPNRNHGIYGNNARLHLYRKMTNFLNEQLKGDGGNYNQPKNARP